MSGNSKRTAVPRRGSGISPVPRHEDVPGLEDIELHSLGHEMIAANPEYKRWHQLLAKKPSLSIAVFGAVKIMLKHRPELITDPDKLRDDLRELASDADSSFRTMDKDK